MAEVSPEELQRRLDEFVRELPVIYTRAAVEATVDLEARIKQRIFNDGKAADGNPIGEYSTTPTLAGGTSVYPKSNFKNLLNDPDNSWRTYKGRRLLLVEGGYKALRDASDLQSDYVDLNFIGNLQRSIKTFETKRSAGLRIKGKKNVLKARGNEARFEKPIFSASDEEVQIAEEIIEQEIDELIQKIFI